MIDLRQGDCLEVMRTLPDESVNCIVTSPPYWGLRDYGHAGQLGLEPTFAEYLTKLVAIFEECRRVLRKDGTCWVNMGDSYFTGAGAARKPGGGTQGKEFKGPDSQPNRHPGAAGKLTAKNLIGQPWRLAFALQDAGWILRSDIIWHKPNPMPESVQDRPTRAHEYVFLFVKSQKYWYDAEAIREGHSRGLTGGKYAPPGQPPHGNARDKQSGHGLPSIVEPCMSLSVPADEQVVGANARTVWSIATQGYPEAHFATFPEELPKRCILAGCPEGGTVLDIFTGSGTTGAIALRLGRKFIGIDLNPEYVELARQRINAETPSLFTEVS